jgi:isochorismate synthase
LNTEIELSKSTISFANACDSLLEYCQHKGYSLAIWRLPFSTKTNVLVSFLPRKIDLETDIESLPPGFLLAEFEKGINGEKLYFNADVLFHFETTIDEEKSKSLIEQLPGFQFKNTENIKEQLALPTISVTEKNSFTETVLKAISGIEQGTFKKVVLSRKKSAKWDDSLSLGLLYKKLCNKYSNTFNSFIFTPDYGTWVGASPETLVSKNANHIFKTIALAGTQKAEGKTEKQANWSQKEIEEQAYVSRYIIECLKKIRVREYEDIGPKTIRVGNIFHLKTDFSVNLNEVAFPNFLGTMLHLLHPTSAVCGMPKTEAIDFVLKNETHPRELYSGYLGPVNIEHETYLFVNLRCVKITDTITFFAGAGITEDSDPEKEFLETELKMESLLGLFE